MENLICFNQSFIFHSDDAAQSSRSETNNTVCAPDPIGPMRFVIKVCDHLNAAHIAGIRSVPDSLCIDLPRNMDNLSSFLRRSLSHPELKTDAEIVAQLQLLIPAGQSTLLSLANTLGNERNSNALSDVRSLWSQIALKLSDLTEYFQLAVDPAVLDRIRLDLLQVHSGQVVDPDNVELVDPRRRSPRTPSSYFAIAQQADHRFGVSLVDISATGIGLRHDDLLVSGAPISLTFSDGTTRHGQVVWRNATRGGVELDFGLDTSMPN